MSGAGSHLFDPDLAELIDEAFERIGVDPVKITARHIRSARRSMNLMLSLWATRGVTDWGVEQAQVTVTPGMTTFDLPEGAYDILEANVIRDRSATPMTAIGREEYHDLPRKDDAGLPDRYFVDRGKRPPKVYIWQIGENSTDVIDYWYFRQYKDVGGMGERLDMPHFFFEAFASGLAARLAEKYQPERLAEKMQIAENALTLALQEDGSRADLRISVRY